MKSMTGYGKAEITSKLGKFVVEISSVNNRFLEFGARLPRQFWAFESRLRELVGHHVDRGKISLYIGFEDSNRSKSQFKLNPDAVDSYYKDLVGYQKKYKLAGSVELRDLVVLPDIASPKAEIVDEEIYWPTIKKVTVKALTALVAMRKAEGEAMAKDMKKRLKTLSKTTNQISRKSPQVVKQYRERLNQRIEDLLGGSVGDPNRLEEEVAIMAEKADITEECTRLLSHIDQFEDTMARPEPCGKKLNFILQELNREANTSAAKCAHIELTKAAILLKEEIEKLRELVQNVE